MVISHSRRFVYVGPPKSGSTSFHKWLTQPLLFDGHVDVNTAITGNQHDWIIPDDASDYFHFSTTRDHATWLDSLWRQSRNDWIDYDDRPLMEWEEFLEWRKTASDPFYSRDLSDYHHPGMLLLRLEHLEDDVQKLPFWTELSGRLNPIPHENHNKRNPSKIGIAS